MSPRRAVFLDRDGVLNKAVVREGVPHPPASVEGLEILPGVPEACQALRDAGFTLIVVTNQPDVARGTQSRTAVEEINQKLQSSVRLDEVRICFHDDRDSCACRKPAPGMLLDAAASWGLELSKSFVVGDRWRDIEAGRRAGCKAVFVNHGYQEKQPATPDLVVHSLAEAVPWIIQQSRS